MAKSDYWLMTITQQVNIKVSFDEEVDYNDAVDLLLEGEGEIMDETDQIIHDVISGEPL